MHTQTKHTPIYTHVHTHTYSRMNTTKLLKKKETISLSNVTRQRTEHMLIFSFHLKTP